MDPTEVEAGEPLTWDITIEAYGTVTNPTEADEGDDR